MPYIYSAADYEHNLALLRRQQPWPYRDMLPLKRQGVRGSFALLTWYKDQLVLHEDDHLPCVVTPEEVLAAGWVVD